MVYFKPLFQVLSYQIKNRNLKRDLTKMYFSELFLTRTKAVAKTTSSWNAKWLTEELIVGVGLGTYSLLNCIWRQYDHFFLELMQAGTAFINRWRTGSKRRTICYVELQRSTEYKLFRRLFLLRNSKWCLEILLRLIFIFWSCTRRFLSRDF